jgi:ribosomal protein L28
MSRVCDICQKSYNQANIVNKLRGKYNRAGKKKQRANLQSKMVDGKRLLVCVNCVRTLLKKSLKK